MLKFYYISFFFTILLSLLENGYAYSEKNTIEKEVITSKTIDTYDIITYALMLIYCISVFIIMIIISRKGKTISNIRTMTPLLCNFVLLGLLMNTLYPLLIILISSPWICKIKFIYEVLYRNLIFISLLFITYRIYSIGKKQYLEKQDMNDSKNDNLKLNNKKLYVKVITILVLLTVISLLYTLIDKFYTQSYDNNINDSHLQYCRFNGYIILFIILSLYFSLIDMIVKKYINE
ncbi:hypothetical protein BCR32DRAFT_247962 [Anaeromyces robustus]|uniref:G-protein coupled receptors family 3 profile domain-containing protein n=1 Tax=Anaeromyces robustus TaxID=1754192 RepID=A0A1Y1WV46_9FUNG|nr:hypothetical protein BCR32DRAFT_247962 [Anaeromyces robustus]|eukprot:ORX77420.1 hypothetical protein BCR32DRAFT_247962 [Anaeromyces robustus]